MRVARDFAAMGGELGISVGPDTTSISDRGAVRARRRCGAADRRRRAASAAARIGARARQGATCCATWRSRRARRRRSRRSSSPSCSTASIPTAGCFRPRRCSRVTRSSRSRPSTSEHYGAGARGCMSPAYSTPRRWKRDRKAFERVDGRRGERRQALPALGRSSVRADRSSGRAAVDGHARAARARSVDTPTGSRSKSPTRCSAARSRRGSRPTSASRRATPTRPTARSTRIPAQASWVETADVTTNVTGPSFKEIFFEIDRLRKEAPPAAELQGIKNNLAGVFVVQNASRSGVIGRLAFVDQHGLGDQYLRATSSASWRSRRTMCGASPTST